jgi:hypothetical protein
VRPDRLMRALFPSIEQGLDEYLKYLTAPGDPRLYSDDMKRGFVDMYTEQFVGRGLDPETARRIATKQVAEDERHYLQNARGPEKATTSGRQERAESDRQRSAARRPNGRRGKSHRSH